MTMKTLLVSSLPLLVGLGLGLFVGVQIAHRYTFHIHDYENATVIFRCDTFTGKVSPVSFPKKPA